MNNAVKKIQNKAMKSYSIIESSCWQVHHSGFFILDLFSIVLGIVNKQRCTKSSGNEIGMFQNIGQIITKMPQFILALKKGPMALFSSDTLFSMSYSLLEINSFPLEDTTGR